MAPAGSQTERAGSRWQLRGSLVPCSQPDAGCQYSTDDWQVHVPATISSRQAEQHAAMLPTAMKGLLAMRGTGRLQQVRARLQSQQPANRQTAATQTGTKSSQQQRGQAITGRMQLQDKIADLLMVAGALLARHSPGRCNALLAVMSKPKRATTYE